ncbi:MULTISPECIES: transposase [Enterococcus]|uniref:transposase n=1 Tax=Enterococcus TaxID=1350 RepID=UPI000EE9B747|nr:MULTISPECIES: transposase [Enterococcus]RXF32302.1 hypothetical protein EG868_09750 [Enterococcus faecalis]UYY20980.1 transposase [Enterococcus faecalis]UYY23548.1 transposase [Enterococcus faecalis]HCM84861.1 hypothetical protein [Enterococcus sp.]
MKAHQHSAGAKKRRTKRSKPTHRYYHGGKTTKIHNLVHGLENPLVFLLTEGQTHDAVSAIKLLKNFDLSRINILVDKAYATKGIHLKRTLRNLGISIGIFKRNVTL